MNRSWNFDEKFPSEVERGVNLIRELIARMEAMDWSGKDVFGVHMAMEEAVMNAIKHGNCRNPDKLVHVRIELDDSRLFVQVADEGEGFDPTAVPDCREDENLEKTSGRGLLLMQNFMDEVRYNQKGNMLEMVKLRVAATN